MKKLLLLTLVTIGGIASSFAQGEVYFANSSASATHIYTNNVLNGWSTSTAAGTGRISAGAGGAYTFALYSAASTVNTVGSSGAWLDSNWTFTGNYATNTATLGRVAIATPDANAAAAIPGFAAGSTASLVIIGWNTAVGGSTVASFLNAWNSGVAGLLYGQSAVASILLGNGGTTPDQLIFGANTGQIGGFTLAPVNVPEPGTFALAGIGAAAMLIFRRRK